MSFWKKKLLTFSSILTEITPPCTDAHTGAIMACRPLWLMHC